MAGAEQALVSILRADAAVAAVVAQRIRPHSDAQNLASPYITYQRISTDPVARPLEGTAVARAARLQVDCWSDERASDSAPKDVFELAEKVRVALDDKGGVFNGATISAIVFEDQRALPEDTRQRVSMDFTFWEKG